MERKTQYRIIAISCIALTVLILLGDLGLLLADWPTISQTVIFYSSAMPLVGVGLAGGICFLIWHFFGEE